MTITIGKALTHRKTLKKVGGHKSSMVISISMAPRAEDRRIAVSLLALDGSDPQSLGYKEGGSPARMKKV